MSARFVMGLLVFVNGNLFGVDAGSYYGIQPPCVSGHVVVPFRLYNAGKRAF